jgi:hypothetical protein
MSDHPPRLWPLRADLLGRTMFFSVSARTDED